MTTTATVATTGDYKTSWSEQDIAMLRQVGIESAEPAELDLFFHVCRRSGLDPFARQIYMIPRETDVRVRVEMENGNTRLETRRVVKQSIQTAIDGFRLIGMRAAAKAGVKVAHDPAVWAGEDGDWRQVFKGTPLAAQYVLRIDDTPVATTVLFEEFAQYSGQGNLTPMWKKSPCNQLSVRAEAACWRKAFPADFAGIELEGSDDPTVIDSDGTPVPRAERGGRGGATVRDRARESTIVEGDITEPGKTPEQRQLSDGARKKWQDRLNQLLTGVDVTAPEQQLVVVGALIGRAGLGDCTDLDDVELQDVVTTLNKATKAGTAQQVVTDIVNAADSAAAETEGNESK